MNAREDDGSAARPTESSSVAEEAQVLVKRDCAVLPLYGLSHGCCTCGKRDCASPGKHPRTARGLKDATQDRDEVTRWTRTWAVWNLGLVTGSASGVLVLDIDPRHGGTESLARLCATHGELPATLLVNTGGGGQHYYFRMPDAAIRNSVGRLGEGLDIRGEGGYVVCPPSSHISGGVYSWDSAEGFRRAGLADVPDWLLRLLTNERKEKIAVRHAPDVILEGERNSTLLSLGGSLRNKGLEYPELEMSLNGLNQRRCHPPLPAEEVESICRSLAKYPVSAETASGEDDHAEAVVLDPGNPLGIARRFVQTEKSIDNTPTLHYLNGDFYEWTDVEYRMLSVESLRSQLYAWLDQKLVKGRDGELQSFSPRKRSIDEIMDALIAATYRDRGTDSGWLVTDQNLPAESAIVPCRNGLLHLPAKELLEPDPRFFTLAAAGVAFNPKAGDPIKWRNFLGQLWPDDPQAIEILQEWFGYCLLPEVNLQKILMLIGPKRAGKGTIADILRRLLGESNVAGPMLSELENRFALSSLIGKSLAVVPDARLGGRANQGAIVERLLALSGGDAMTLDRKFRDPWCGVITTRLMILTNELPRLGDAAGALSSRFIVLQLRESFYGKEDPKLANRLAEELPAILNWAIEGLERLRARGYFQTPTSGEALRHELEDLESPVSMFVNECCKLGSDRAVPTDELYQAWRQWCEQNGFGPGSKPTFARDLHAAYPAITNSQPRTNDGSRQRCKVGLSLVRQPGFGLGLCV